MQTPKVLISRHHKLNCRRKTRYGAPGRRVFSLTCVCLWGLGGSHLNFYTPPIWIFPFVQSDGLLFFLLWCEIMLFMLVKQRDKFPMRMSEYDKSESFRLSCKKQKSESRDGSLQIWFPVTASCQCFLNSWSYFSISIFLHEFE